MIEQQANDRRNRIAAALEAIRVERDYQTSQWGERRPEFPVWLAILTKEIGELAEAISVRHTFQHEVGASENPDVIVGDQMAARGALREARQEAVQAAAVLVAMIEQIDETIDAPLPVPHDEGAQWWDERTRRWEERTGQSR